MMSQTQHLLVKLAEEAAELSKEALKAVQFGIDDTHNGVSCLERINKEYTDLIAIVEMLDNECNISIEFDPFKKNDKIKQVARWRFASMGLGMVNPKKDTDDDSPTKMDV